MFSPSLFTFWNKSTFIDYFVLAFQLQKVSYTKTVERENVEHDFWFHILSFHVQTSLMLVLSVCVYVYVQELRGLWRTNVKP